MWKISAALFLAKSALFAGSVMLINDSHFPLIAQIFNAVGDERTSIRLTPGQQLTWNDNQSSFSKQYDEPTTPYTVRFLCLTSRPYDYVSPPKNKNKANKRPSYQAEFGAWTNVATGQLVNALGCTQGTKSCVISNKSKQYHSPQSREYKKQSFNDFTNDGGETWINNGGPGWENNDLQLED